MGSLISGAKVAEVVKKLLGGRAPVGGRDPPSVPQGPGCCRAVVADMTLQHRVDIGGSFAGLVDWGGGSLFLRRGTRGGVVTLLSLPG